jgi:hypothetical protein
MAQPDKVRGRVVDAHSHIGTMDAWQFYDLKEPVKPTVYEFDRASDYLNHVDGVGVERGLGAAELRHPGPGPRVLAQARRRTGHRRAQDDLPARRQPRPEHLGRRHPRAC